MSKRRDARHEPPRPAAAERALLVQVTIGHGQARQAAESLHELERLADTAGTAVAGVVTQRREKPTAAFFVGEGKLADIQLAARQAGAALVIFDNELSAVQAVNLNQALGLQVIDRTELILQIFVRRARSAEAKIQVELARMEYLVSRIPYSREQQRFEGVIGMRGPGESPLALRNEPIRRRIRDLRRKLKAVHQHRRRTRQRRQWPVVCLVGYTNAGKSTLLNAFSNADAYVDDRLFATLDTKTRLVDVAQGHSVLMTDTVGFIRHLPHRLVAAFRSTLEVAAEADLLLVVADAGHAHLEDHLKVVDTTLEEIEARHVPSLLILNKWDTVGDAETRAALIRDFPRGLRLSARHGQGMQRLKSEIVQALAHGRGRTRPAGRAADGSPDTAEPGTGAAPT